MREQRTQITHPSRDHSPAAHLPLPLPYILSHNLFLLRPAIAVVHCFGCHCPRCCQRLFCRWGCAFCRCPFAFPCPLHATLLLLLHHLHLRPLLSPPHGLRGLCPAPVSQQHSQQRFHQRSRVLIPLLLALCRIRGTLAIFRGQIVADAVGPFAEQRHQGEGGVPFGGPVPQHGSRSRCPPTPLRTFRLCASGIRIRLGASFCVRRCSQSARLRSLLLPALSAPHPRPRRPQLHRPHSRFVLLPGQLFRGRPLP